MKKGMAAETWTVLDKTSSIIFFVEEVEQTSFFCDDLGIHTNFTSSNRYIGLLVATTGHRRFAINISKWIKTIPGN
jgi:hypothetical protein